MHTFTKRAFNRVDVCVKLKCVVLWLSLPALDAHSLLVCNAGLFLVCRKMRGVFKQVQFSPHRVAAHQVSPQRRSVNSHILYKSNDLFGLKQNRSWSLSRGNTSRATFSLLYCNWLERACTFSGLRMDSTCCCVAMEAQRETRCSAGVRVEPKATRWPSRCFYM